MFIEVINPVEGYVKILLDAQEEHNVYLFPIKSFISVNDWAGWSARLYVVTSQPLEK